MTQAYYRKWRPQTWDEVIGQDHVISTLHNAVTADRVAHAYLFAGPRGTGKTSSARLLAKAVNCLEENLADRPCNQCDHCQAVNNGRFLDLIEIDAASNTSVDDVRDLRDKINFLPNLGRYKVYIIDEVHMLSTAAFNALLKTLEEPPAHAIFILATTEVHKIPATVLSRCQRHEFRRIPLVEIVKQLTHMAEAENLKVEPEALTLIARQATGSMRDAISLLDQLASTTEEISLQIAQTVLGTAASQSVLEIVGSIITKDAPQGLGYIHQSLDAGSDPRQFARQIVDYLRALLLIRSGSGDQVDVTSDVRSQMAKHAQAFPPKELIRVIRLFNQAANELRVSWQPALPMELAFLGALETPLDEIDKSPEKGIKPNKKVTNQGPPSGKSKLAASLEETSKPEGPTVNSAPQADPVPRSVLNNWDKIRSLIRQYNPQTQGLINSCQPLGVRDGILVLGFSSDLIKAKMEQDDHIKITRQAIADVLNEEIPIQCVTVAKRTSLPPDVDQDGMVASAMRDLGGEIVDIQ
jgi:DNA polymerase-3 subunit gamma/tau